MKIIFICGSLESGRDGVGDYTKRLAVKMTEQGHQIAVIGLKDNFSTQEFTGNLKVENSYLPVLRLPSALGVKYRLKQAKKYIDNFEPDWLSLQFVPFMFHPKGLPFDLGRQLAFLGNGRRWHIMFHELWLGIEVETSKKRYYWGLIQKSIIKQLVKKLHPGLIHTQTRLYQQELSNIGVHAEHLPLFGNIPNLETTEIEAAAEQSVAVDHKALLIVIFGGIDGDAPVKQLVQEVSLYAKNKKIPVKLVIVGRCGKEQEHWVREWKRAEIPVEVLGEQSTENISRILKKASLGISVNPIALVEKSGTAAAMLEHGLPVICVSRKWHPRHCFKKNSSPGIFEYEIGSFEELISRIKKFSPVNNLSEATHQLEQELILLL